MSYNIFEMGISLSLIKIKVVFFVGELPLFFFFFHLFNFRF